MSNKENDTTGMARPRGLRRPPDKAEAWLVEGGGHLLPDSPTVTRHPSVAELLECVLRDTEPDLTDEQVRRAATAGAELIAVREDPERFVAAVASLVAKHQLALAKPRAAGVPEPSAPTAADVDATQRTADYLRAEVIAVRQALFESPNKPFNKLVDAAVWARQEESRHALADAQYEEIYAVVRTLGELGSPVRVDANERYVLLQEKPIESAPTFGGEPSAADLPGLADLMSRPPWVFRAGRSKALGYLSDVQRRLSAQAGVEEWEVTRHILLGVPPATRRWRPQGPNASLLWGRDVPLWFTIEIRDSAFSKEEVGEVFDNLRREGLLISARVRDERRRQRELLDFNRARRDLAWPVMRVADVVADWNAAHPGGPHYTPSSWLKALRKARKAFDEQEPVRLRGRCGASAAAQSAPQAGQRTARPEAVHPLVAMNEQAERALAGDPDAQREVLADYERALGPQAVEALRAGFQFNVEIKALVARGLAGDAAAREEAIERVALVRGYLSAEELRERFGQAHDKETADDDHGHDRDHDDDGAGDV